MPHLSDSVVQRDAEAMIVARLGARLGIELVAGGRIGVGGGAHVQVDARTEGGDVLVEAYARHGALKGAQLKKVAQDVLKFALLRRSEGWGDARMILAFASTEAMDSIRGWVAEAARAFDVELIEVDLPHDLSERILAAQQKGTAQDARASRSKRRGRSTLAVEPPRWVEATDMSPPWPWTIQ